MGMDGHPGNMSQYTGNGPTTNGHSGQNSPNSSNLSGGTDGQDATLVSRTQKKHTTQQVTTTTRTIREIQYLGPDGQPLDYVPNAAGNGQNYEHVGNYDPSAVAFNHHPDYQPSSISGQGGNYHAYHEYPHSPPSPPCPSDRSGSPPPQHREPDYMRQTTGAGGRGIGNSYPPRSGYDELDTTLMPPRPGEHYGRGISPATAGSCGSASGGGSGSAGMNPTSSSANPNYATQGYYGDGSIDDPTSGVQDNSYDPNFDNSVFEENAIDLPLDSSHHGRGDLNSQDLGFGELQDHQGIPKASVSPLHRGVPGVHWRDPDLHEVIEFLANPNNVIKANAAAYLQHLCYMDDPVKAKTRQLGGVPPLVALLSHEIPEIHRNACGALRNLSYGRQNDENKRAIKNAGGIATLVRLLRKATDNEVKELVTGVLWNLSSCDDLKRAIIDEALSFLVDIVIIPYSGWNPNFAGEETRWTTVFRNASGILRNVSSAGDYGRKKLRECEGLCDSVLYVVKKAIEKANIDNKSVENCVCVLRNLSYRAQEVEDPNYDKKHMLAYESRAGAKPNGDNSGCFGGGKHKRNDAAHQTTPFQTNPSSSRNPRTSPVKGMELLWQPEVVQPYLHLLSNCSNPETLEAAAGAIQNLSACYWQASMDVRATVRKEKGLPILVELLRMEVDRVVCAVATALRNLAIDPRNKDLVGRYAMRDLVQKLPTTNPQHDHGTSDGTVAAVLATLNEVIKKQPDFSRSLLEAGGVDRLVTITRQRQRFSPRVVKFASQVLYSMWAHQELREVYKKAGWRDSDFVTKNARPNSPTNMNSTLNRPMASQSGTRYEDRSMQRGIPGSGQVAAHMNNSGYGPEDVPMENLSIYGGNVVQDRSGYHPAGQMVRPGEPVYAQVNRDKKKSRSGPQDHIDQQLLHHHQQQQLQNQRMQYVAVGNGDYSDHVDHWQVVGAPSSRGQVQLFDSATANRNPDQAGDSWV